MKVLMPAAAVAYTMNHPVISIAIPIVLPILLPVLLPLATLRGDEADSQLQLPFAISVDEVSHVIASPSIVEAALQFPRREQMQLVLDMTEYSVHGPREALNVSGTVRAADAGGGGDGYVLPVVHCNFRCQLRSSGPQ
ncbi:unnamed protein product [Sphagnum tenellum]